ncbi:MAG: SRPBCC family protein [Pyrinomonadaceae bacterium]
MSFIRLETFIRAPAEICFDLARDIGVHMAAPTASADRAVAGVTSGPVGLGDEVTWEGTHFGVRQRLTSRIVAFDRPRMFADEMRRGAFKRWRHTHLFEPQAGGTLMTDEVEFASPLGPVGAVVDALVLKNYMTRFLRAHNGNIKKLAERAAGGDNNAAAGSGEPF